MDATCVQIGLRGENYTLKVEEFPQIYGSYVKSETLDSCRSETKMRLNTPNPISISIFFRGSPRTSATGGSAPDPGEGGRGGKGKGKKGEGKEESLRHCRWGDRCH